MKNPYNLSVLDLFPSRASDPHPFITMATGLSLMDRPRMSTRFWVKIG